MKNKNSDWPWRFFFLAIAGLLIVFLNLHELASPARAAVVPEAVPIEALIPIEADEAAKASDPREADVQHLAVAIYREAGGDAVCDTCRYRVGDVVLNRVADPRFPDTIEGVLAQKGQYGTMHWEGVVWPKRASLPQERHAVDRAEAIARALLTGAHSDLAGEGYIFQSEFPNLGHSATTCCGIYYAKG